MDPLMWFALFILAVLGLAAAGAAVYLSALPGKIARRRCHPQADAITACGWLGLLTLGALWPIALVWAYSRPIPTYPLRTGELSDRYHPQTEREALSAAGGAHP